MKKSTLDKIKNNLEERREKIQKELEGFAKKDENVKDNYKSDFPDFGDKEDENAKEIAQYTDNLSIEHSLEKTLRDINKALDRIDHNDYGTCKYCKKDIPEKRLLARPSSSACIVCKDKLTSQ